MLIVEEIEDATFEDSVTVFEVWPADWTGENYAIGDPLSRRFGRFRKVPDLIILSGSPPSGEVKLATGGVFYFRFMSSNASSLSLNISWSIVFEFY